MVTSDPKDKLAAVGVGVSTLLFTLFYRLYRSKISSAEQIKSSRTLHVGADLIELLKETEGNSIAYATVEGVVSPIHQTISSKHGPMVGVVQQWEHVEHKSKRVQGYWSDAKRVISSSFESVPFTLMNLSEPGHLVHVTEVQDAELIVDDLTVTFDQFSPEKSNLFQAGMDRVFGDVTKGFQETEKMLLVGTSLVGIGEVCLHNNQIQLGPPDKGSYILSKLSKNAIIRKFESQSFVYKVMSLILGTVTAGLTFYIIWKFAKRFLEEKKKRRIFEEIRAATRTTLEGGDAALADAEMCIICLSNTRDVVILNCGHVCLCSHCAEILPEPKCPVCRAPIDRFVPLYRS